MTRNLPGTEFDCPHLTERELAARWRVSLRTVQRWRHKGVAPPHLLLGRAPIFPLKGLVAFEAEHLEEER